MRTFPSQYIEVLLLQKVPRALSISWAQDSAYPEAQQFGVFVAGFFASFFMVVFTSSPISHMGIFIPRALFSHHLYFKCPCSVSSFSLNNPINLYFLMFCFQKHLEILLKGTPTYLEKHHQQVSVEINKASLGAKGDGGGESPFRKKILSNYEQSLTGNIII